MFLIHRPLAGVAEGSFWTLIMAWCINRLIHNHSIIIRSSKHWICLRSIKRSVGAVGLLSCTWERKRDVWGVLIDERSRAVMQKDQSRCVTSALHHVYTHTHTHTHTHTLHHPVISSLLIRLPVAHGWFRLCQMHIPHKHGESFSNQSRTPLPRLSQQEQWCWESN